MKRNVSTFAKINTAFVAMVGLSGTVASATGVTMGSTCPYSRASCAGTPLFVAACAPEVQSGNIAAMDRVLSELAGNQLKDAVKFRAVISKIAALPPNEHISASLNLAGIESDQEIAEFVGSRDQVFNPKHVDAVSKNLELNRDQAEMVLSKISAALLGERR